MSLPKEMTELDEALGICGCCDTKGVWLLIRDYLEACRSEYGTEDHKDVEPQWERQRTLLCGESEWTPLAYVFLSVMQRLDLTEHGTAIRCSWLTEKGEAILAILTDENIDAFEKDKYDS
jgi:hypothetical protein